MNTSTVNDLCWCDGEPPKDGKVYLVQYSGGIICSARYRNGQLREPTQQVVDWRCDCCGRYATPIKYAVMD